MKFLLEKSQVKLVPETEHERENLDALWKLVIRCDTDSKVLCPVASMSPVRMRPLVSSSKINRRQTPRKHLPSLTAPWVARSERKLSFNISDTLGCAVDELCRA